MSRKGLPRQPHTEPIVFGSKPKPKKVVKAEAKGPPTLASYFSGDDRYIAHFKKLPPDRREDEIKAGRVHVIWGPSESRELRNRLHAQIEGLDNSLRLGHAR